MDQNKNNTELLGAFLGWMMAAAVTAFLIYELLVGFRWDNADYLGLLSGIVGLRLIFLLVIYNKS